MTTIVGLKGKDFYIIGADKTSSTYYAEQRFADKIYQVMDNIYAGGAGTAATIREFVDVLRLICKNYKRKGIKLNIDNIAKYASKLLYSSKYEFMYGFVCTFIIGGFDGNSPKLYSLDPIGHLTELKKYGVEGSGSTFAISVLDSLYHENITKEEGIDLVAKALRAAGGRDLYSGKLPIYDIIVVEKDKVYKYRVEGDKIENISNSEDSKGENRSRSTNRKRKK